MPKFIATYDLEETTPSPHSTFLDQAAENGWQPWILGSNDNWYRLPNTTLIGTFADRKSAVAALKKTKADTQAVLGRTVTMVKWIVSDRGGSSFDSDERQPKD